MTVRVVPSGVDEDRHRQFALPFGIDLEPKTVVKVISEHPISGLGDKPNSIALKSHEREVWVRAAYAPPERYGCPHKAALGSSLPQSRQFPSKGGEA